MVGRPGAKDMCQYVRLRSAADSREWPDVNTPRSIESGRNVAIARPLAATITVPIRDEQGSRDKRHNVS